MCGRFSQFSDVVTIAGRFDADIDVVTRTPQYNLAPGMDAAIVIAAHHDAVLSRYRVSTVVNAARNNAAACIAPVPHPTE